MDINKIAHEAFETARVWHFPLLLGLVCSIRVMPKDQYNQGDLGDVPGDNILPKNILISLSSRRGL